MSLKNLTLTLCGEIKPQSYSAIVDDTLDIIMVGGTYFFQSPSDCGLRRCTPTGCYIVEDIRLTDGITTTTLISEYNDCDSCLNAEANYLIFSNCYQVKDLAFIYVDKSQITPAPTVGETYFLKFYISLNGQNTSIYEGCFTFEGYDFSNQGYSLYITNYSATTDCQTCIDNSGVIYEIVDCLDSTTHYISYPNNTLGEGNIITYTDLSQLTQYCGTVIRQIIGSPSTVDAILISDLGNPKETGVTCEDCLGTVAEKKKIINCLNPSDTEIVWASTLFYAGEATNISTAEGCYEISPDVVPPESAITINELANYAPQENCQDCLECYGVTYNFQTCEPVEVCGAQNLYNFGAYFEIWDFAISSSNIAYIPSYTSGVLKIFDLSTSTLLYNISTGQGLGTSFAIDENNNIGCLTNNGFNTITFIDLNTLAISTVNTPTNSPWKVYFNPNDGYFYVCCLNSSSDQSINVYSGITYSGMTNIANFGNSGYRDIVGVGSNLYAIDVGGILEGFSVTAGPTYTFLGGQSFFCSSIRNLDYDASTNNLYISADCNKFFIYSLSTFIPVTVTYANTCGYSNRNIKINNVTNKIYITDIACNHIFEFDKGTNILIRTYDNLYSQNVLGHTYGMALDSSGGTWFTSTNAIFQLGCSNEILTGITTSNEYVDIGSTFFNYTLSACCEITQITPNYDAYPFSVYNNEYLSLVHYNDCLSCTGQTHELFYCTGCGFGTDFEAILVAPTGTYSVGDYVRSQYGNSDFICFYIEDVYTFESYGGGYTSFQTSGGTYTTCEECQSGGTVGITVINCNTLIAQQVNITLDQWITIAGIPYNLPFTVVSDENGTCYQITDLCPIDSTGPLFTIKGYYINQLFCSLNERGLPPISAGTEYFACQICETESGTTVTQIAVPHPTWARPDGRAVVLLDTVQLGGMFGLNS